jgi:hypothetical protein
MPETASPRAVSIPAAAAAALAGQPLLVEMEQTVLAHRRAAAVVAAAITEPQAMPLGQPEELALTEQMAVMARPLVLTLSPEVMGLSGNHRQPAA